MRFMQLARAEFQQWSHNIRLFFIANIFYQIGNGIFSVLYNLYLQSLGYPHEMNGTIISVTSLATALMILPIGWLGDRSSRKMILIIGALLTGISFIGRTYAEAELGLQIFAIISGLFAAFFQVIAVPFLAKNAPKEQRLQLFSYHFSAMLAAQVLGSVGGGLLADLLQSIGWSKPASLQIALLIAGIVSIAAIIPLFYIREKRNLEDVEKIEHSIENTVQDTSQESIVKRSATSVLSTAASSEWKIIGIITFAQLLVGFGSGLVVPYLNLYFTDRFSMSLSAVGLLISLGQIMTIFSMLIGPKLVHRVGQVNAVVIFQLLSLPFLLLTGFTNLVLVASVTFLFRQALMNAANPIQSAILVDKISDNRRSIANSLTQAVFMLGWASMGQVQPRLITAYGTYWGYVVTFSLTGVLYVSAALYFYLMIGRRNRNTISHETG